MSRYLCYILQSCMPRQENKIYIGCTNNLARRLRQHNGELKRGGAKYTHKYRPWKVLATVRHFASEREALQFEWAWQNPAKSRHLRSQRTARLVSASRTANNHLCAAGFLIQARHWLPKKLKLHAHSLSDSTIAHLSGVFGYPLQNTAVG
jgi:structure-specific endonuclease subunit SLX1